MIQDWVSRFEDLKILVVGDVILDRYWWGEAQRLSPEAPVPVLVKRRTSALPGGAANSAANAASMGAQVELLGLAGEDAEAMELRQILSERRIGCQHLVESSTRPTTTKTRYIAGHQQLLRVDAEQTAPIAAGLEAALLQNAIRALANTRAVLISDYAKGLLTPSLLQGITRAAAAAGQSTFADPKGADFRRYLGVTYLKPNRAELGLLLGKHITNHAETLAAGEQLRGQMPGTHLLVTEGADGMTLFQASGGQVHVSSEAREVFDITGAGDTVLAAFSLAITAGASPVEAMEISSAAAGITVATVGAAAVGAAELKQALLRRAAR
jgi:D-beta-D-heptose 7-phosphate kinase / D-beta-D-heptose 1-phosphate adenosyltransferase